MLPSLLRAIWAPDLLAFFGRRIIAPALLAFGWAAFAAAQMITPDDARDKARFEAVSKAVVKSGYAAPVVVNHQPFMLEQPRLFDRHPIFVF